MFTTQAGSVDLFRHKHLSFTTLVVDNKLSFAAFLLEFLKVDGPLILRAGTAEEALAKTREFQPDLILLNSEIKGVRSLALLSSLLMAQASAAVVIMSSQPSIAEAVQAIQRGAADYLARPLDPGKLQEVVDAQKKLFQP